MKICRELSRRVARKDSGRLADSSRHPRVVRFLAREDD